jgi:predicted DNA-binding transcriptional regulator AlpA
MRQKTPKDGDRLLGTHVRAKTKRHNLDRRADVIAARSRGYDDDLLPTVQVADWIGVSHQWLEIGRLKGYGPPYVRVGPRHIRYKRSDVLAWLNERTHASTAEYV